MYCIHFAWAILKYLPIFMTKVELRIAKNGFVYTPGMTRGGESKVVKMERGS